MAKKPDIKVTPSSGNVFADIGVQEPEEELAKAQLASRIREIVRQRRLTQVAAAGILRIDQPKVSALVRGRLSGFSIERLLRFIRALEYNVEIHLTPLDPADGREEGVVMREDEGQIVFAVR